MIVNLDTRTVAIPEALNLPAPPDAAVARFRTGFLALPLDYEMVCASSSIPYPEADVGARAHHAERLQKMCQVRALCAVVVHTNMQDVCVLD